MPVLNGDVQYSNGHDAKRMSCYSVSITGGREHGRKPTFHDVTIDDRHQWGVIDDCHFPLLQWVPSMGKGSEENAITKW